jgi:transcriptional regulator with XRE-family HTH domain
MRDMEQIRRELQDHRLEVVAAETGLSYNTVRRYATGVVTNPPLESVQLLSGWLDKQGAPASAK